MFFFLKSHWRRKLSCCHSLSPIDHFLWLQRKNLGNWYSNTVLFLCVFLWVFFFGSKNKWTYFVSVWPWRAFLFLLTLALATTTSEILQGSIFVPRGLCHCWAICVQLSSSGTRWSFVRLKFSNAKIKATIWAHWPPKLENKQTSPILFFRVMYRLYLLYV